MTSELPATDQQLLLGVQLGDEVAAGELLRRYLDRLTAVARQRLSKKLSARIDADDIVMSAYRSFFLRARRGDFEIEPGADLWRLLLEITLHKLYRQNTYHAAQRRAAQRENSDATGSPPTAASREPNPEVAIALADELEAALASLPPEVRHVLELRLQGYEHEEIAELIGKSTRSVRRWLDQAKQALRIRFPAVTSARRQRSPRTKHRPQPLPLELLAGGRLLEFSDYTLKRQIGSGGSGKVYRAEMRASGEIVAVKFIKRSLLKRRDAVERFLSEARLVATLQHPGIIRIQGLGRTPNRGYFLAMDFHEQGDLGRLASPPSLADALRWTHQAALAVAHVHERGVIHCDLKPGNLLLAADGRVVVSDFGLARFSADSDAEQIAGTPAYLSPEQLASSWGKIAPTTDVYGLGAILYTLVVGYAPRNGSVQQVLTSVAAGEAVSIPLDMPSHIAEICRRALAPSPADRYLSASDFSAALLAIS